MNDFLKLIKGKWDEANNNLANMTPEQKQEMAMSMVMGATTAPTSSMPSVAKIKLISNADRDIMGKAAEMIETGATKAMGRIGNDAQNIVEGLGGKATMGNKAMKSFFDAVLKRMDDLGIKAVEEPFIKKINLK